jgi:hypothetical protein
MPSLTKIFGAFSYYGSYYLRWLDMHIPSFITIVSGIHVILIDLRVYSVGITDVKDL